MNSAAQDIVQPLESLPDAGVFRGAEDLENLRDTDIDHAERRRTICHGNDDDVAIPPGADLRQRTVLAKESHVGQRRARRHVGKDQTRRHVTEPRDRLFFADFVDDFMQICGESRGQRNLLRRDRRAAAERRQQQRRGAGQWLRSASIS